MKTSTTRSMTMRIEAKQGEAVVGECRISINIPVDMAEKDIDDHVDHVMNAMMTEIGLATEKLT